MKRLFLNLLLIAIMTVLFTDSIVSGADAPDPGDKGPYQSATKQVSLTNPDTGNELDATIFFPAIDEDLDPSGAPYPGVVFAPGFLSLRGTYEGNGEHLASWGYILITIPDFPPVRDEDLVSDVLYLVSYLESKNSNPQSPFFGAIDVGRLGLVGHSKGGIAVLIAANRDSRIKTVVSLDPSAGGWDHEAEIPPISIPTAIVAAPPNSCNEEGSYDDIYAVATAPHRATYVISEASHCDFMDTDSVLQQFGCVLVCGGSYDNARVQLANRYTTAWLNYYLRAEPEYFSYLYGDDAQEDIDHALITRVAHTATQQVLGTAVSGAAHLTWQLTGYSVLSGTNIYRSEQSDNYPENALAQLGSTNVYTDSTVLPGLTYHYVLRDRDSAGSIHMPSKEVAIPFNDETVNRFYLPFLIFNLGDSSH